MREGGPWLAQAKLGGKVNAGRACARGITKSLKALGGSPFGVNGSMNARPLRKAQNLERDRVPPSLGCPRALRQKTAIVSR